MKNLWRDTEAEAMVAAYADRGVGRALALRVYTTRLLGGEPRLVLHGGGNTSVKTRVTDALGEDVEVLCVKGSGWDMAAIEPEGLPAVRLDALRRLGALDSLSDEDMVGLVRQGLLDGSAPNPSVETLLHAFLPHQYVDHTHAAAVLAVTDQPDGAERCAEVYGDALAVAPYIMPGFPLAKAVAAIYAERPRIEGLILLKHGIFTFGESARQAYERMIAHVSRAEEYLRRARRKVLASASLPAPIAPAARVAPILRGLTALVVDAGEGLYRPFVLDFRGGETVLGYVNGAELARYSQAGVVTPDHAIRTKNTPLIVPPPHADVPGADALDAFRAGAKAAIEAYVAAYRAYFERHNAREPTPKTALDAMPRVILAPGLGLFGLGGSAREARIAADIAENAVEVITDAEAIGRFESISEAEAFETESWARAPATPARAPEAPLARHVVVVTGGGGGIGAATAAAFASEGAEVAILDKDAAAAGETARRIGGAALGLGCDVTQPDEVEGAFGRVCETFGGLDVVVSNAGAAWQGRIGEVGDGALRDSFELNFFAHQTVARTAVRVLRAQGIGGVLLFNASKQALDPGPDFGPYGLPKAATLALARQYAVDYGRDGIRSNAVNADRVRTGIYAGGVLEERARARGQSVAEYLAGANLLKREVKTDDVAQAFVALAKARKTTGAILTVDGGNIAAAPR